MHIFITETFKVQISFYQLLNYYFFQMSPPPAIKLLLLLKKKREKGEEEEDMMPIKNAISTWPLCYITMTYHSFPYKVTRV